MNQYLISVYQPEGGTPPARELDKIMRDVDALNEEIRAAGSWVFAGGLHPSSTATVVRLQDGEMLVTDGPFVEGKEHIGGVWGLQAADPDGGPEGGPQATRAGLGPRGGRPPPEGGRTAPEGPPRGPRRAQE